MKKAFCILAVLFSATVSFADLKLASAPPQPVETTTLRVSNLKPVWENGVALDPYQITGTWNTLAVATTQACAYGTLDATDLKGVKNSDGTPFVQLVFAETQGISIPGQPNPDFLTVTVNNMGGGDDDQGPYKVDGAEPQFATWPYGDGTSDPNTYWSFNCRGVAGNSSQMICAMNLNSPLQDTTVTACINDGLGIYLFLEKQ